MFDNSQQIASDHRKTWTGAALSLLQIAGLSAVLAMTGAGASHAGGPQDRPIILAQTAKLPTAQAPAAVPIPDRLKKAEAILEQEAAAFKEKDVSDEKLQAMRDRLSPVQVELLEVNAALSDAQKAAKARLDQLGVKPKEGAPAESAAVATQRLNLKTGFDEADALYKRAKVALVKIEQLQNNIVNRRRSLLQSIVLKRSRSVLHPLFWQDAAQAVPDALRSIGWLARSWIDYAGAQLNKGYWTGFLALLLGLLALYAVLWKVSRRILPRREGGHPDDFQKVVSAIWVAAVVFAVPSVIAAALLEGLRYFNLVNAAVEPLALVLLQSVQQLALTAGLARGMLAPAKQYWRLINIDSLRAVRLSRLAFRVMSIFVLMRITESLLILTAAPLVMSQVLLVAGTLAVALTIAITLYGTASVAARMDQELGPVIDQQPAFVGLWRLCIWASVILIIGANVLGYLNVADFAVHQIVRITFIFVVAFLLVLLTGSGLAKSLEPGSAAAKVALATFGLREQSVRQTGIVLTGILKLFIFIVAGAALLTPWGVDTVSLGSTLHALFFGYEIGGVRISLSSVALALALLFGGYAAARAFQGWLEQSYLPQTSLDQGLQNSISTSAKYLGVTAAIAVSLGYLGLNFEKLAIVAGALSLGIGFGLQAIVSNFVSGLILLWERSIKVGDWVVVGSDEGYVRRINVRSTEIETFDRQMVIVPNSNLISGVVKNWVKNDLIGRIIVPVGVSYDSDPEHVRDILLRCSRTHELIMDDPAPYVVFADFGDSSLNFELRCFVSNVDNALSVRSHLRFEIFRCLKEADIEIPFPQRDINLRDFDKMTRLIGQGRDDGSAATEPSK